jgi:hypothetical protein
MHRFRMVCRQLGSYPETGLWKVMHMDNENKKLSSKRHDPPTSGKAAMAGRPGVSTVATNFTGWVVVLYLYGATAYRFHMEVNCASFSSACFDKFVPFVEIQSGFQPDDSRSP